MMMMMMMMMMINRWICRSEAIQGYLYTVCVYIYVQLYRYPFVGTSVRRGRAKTKDDSGSVSERAMRDIHCECPYKLYEGYPL